MFFTIALRGGNGEGVFQLFGPPGIAVAVGGLVEQPLVAGQEQGFGVLDGGGAGGVVQGYQVVGMVTGGGG